jgi:acyl-CoA reductase-like NAD-dependent aldehyde dehydrogenase
MLESVNRVTGEVIGVFPVDGGREAALAMSRAGEAAGWWAGLGWDERRARLLAWKSHLVRYLERFAQVVHEETGKPLDDARLEILMTATQIDWVAKHARSALRSRRVWSATLTFNLSSTVEYQPLGVVGVIGSRHHPVLNTAGPIAYALAAGNAVVFKPSEQASGTGNAIVASFASALSLFDEEPPPVLQVLTGPGSTGDALARAGVAKLAFTGSAEVAWRVMAEAAEALTPVLADTGGGRVHGPDGLRSFAVPSVTTRQRYRPLMHLSGPETAQPAKQMARLTTAFTVLHGRLYYRSAEHRSGRIQPGSLRVPGRRGRAGRGRR